MTDVEHDPDCLSHDGGRYCDCQGLVRPVEPGRLPSSEHRRSRVGAPPLDRCTACVYPGGGRDPMPWPWHLCPHNPSTALTPDMTQPAERTPR